MAERVFVIQKQMLWNKELGELVPKFDMSPAEVFGDLVYLLSPTAGPFNSNSIIDDLHEGLHDYCDLDCLLLVGNPCLIGWTVAVAASKNNGRVRLLQWSNRPEGSGHYVEISAYLKTDLRG